MAKKRIRTHTNPLNFHKRLEKVDLSKVFENHNSEIDFEIGFGKGVFLKHYAKQHPNRNIIGVDVRKQIVDYTQNKLEIDNIKNTHLIHGNGQIVLEDMIDDESISNIFIFHPDPWFKNKHHKRRVITKTFLNILEKKLKPTGKIYISTDVEKLFIDMLKIINNHNSFKEIKDDSFWETSYLSHWHLFSKKDKRDIFYTTYQLRP